MKSLHLIVWVILLCVIIGVGYGVYVTNGSDLEVENQLAEITPTEERITVDPQILSRPVVSEVENYRTFGEQPVKANPAALNRVNPFDTL